MKMPNRHFTIAALGALLALRRYMASNPEVNAHAAAESLRRIDVDNAGLDFETAIELHSTVVEPTNCDDAGVAFRSVLAELAAKERPFWIRLSPYGREKVRSALSPEEDQCLRSANLFDVPPVSAIVDWWDRLAHLARSELDDKLLQQGREGERRSLAYEALRLRSIGIPREPKWISIEDNTAGYDILSYNLGPVEPIARLIEVKSSTMQPPRFIITRNEWETAERYGDRVVFHLWETSATAPYEMTAAEVAAHIPEDAGDGRWLQIEITPTGMSLAPDFS